MMVVLFPVMLYQAPSGLTLYILTSSAIGIMEGRMRSAGKRLRIEIEIVEEHLVGGADRPVKIHLHHDQRLTDGVQDVLGVRARKRSFESHGRTVSHPHRLTDLAAGSFAQEVATGSPPSARLVPSDILPSIG